MPPEKKSIDSETTVVGRPIQTENRLNRIVGGGTKKLALHKRETPVTPATRTEREHCKKTEMEFEKTNNPTAPGTKPPESRELPPPPILPERDGRPILAENVSIEEKATGVLQSAPFEEVDVEDEPTVTDWETSETDPGTGRGSFAERTAIEPIRPPSPPPDTDRAEESIRRAMTTRTFTVSENGGMTDEEVGILEEPEEEEEEEEEEKKPVKIQISDNPGSRAKTPSLVKKPPQLTPEEKEVIDQATKKLVEAKKQEAQKLVTSLREEIGKTNGSKEEALKILEELKRSEGLVETGISEQELQQEIEDRWTQEEPIEYEGQATTEEEPVVINEVEGEEPTEEVSQQEPKKNLKALWPPTKSSLLSPEPSGLPVGTPDRPEAFEQERSTPPQGITLNRLKFGKLIGGLLDLFSGPSRKKVTPEEEKTAVMTQEDLRGLGASIGKESRTATTEPAPKKPSLWRRLFGLPSPEETKAKAMEVVRRDLASSAPTPPATEERRSFWSRLFGRSETPPPTTRRGVLTDFVEKAGFWAKLGMLVGLTQIGGSAIKHEGPPAEKFRTEQVGAGTDIDTDQDTGEAVPSSATPEGGRPPSTEALHDHEALKIGTVGSDGNHNSITILAQHVLEHRGYSTADAKEIARDAAENQGLLNSGLRGEAVGHMAVGVASDTGGGHHITFHNSQTGSEIDPSEYFYNQPFGSDHDAGHDAGSAADHDAAPEATGGHAGEESEQPTEGNAAARETLARGFAADATDAPEPSSIELPTADSMIRAEGSGAFDQGEMQKTTEEFKTISNPSLALQELYRAVTKEYGDTEGAADWGTKIEKQQTQEFYEAIKKFEERLAIETFEQQNFPTLLAQKADVEKRIAVIGTGIGPRTKGEYAGLIVAWMGFEEAIKSGKTLREIQPLADKVGDKLANTSAFLNQETPR